MDLTYDWDFPLPRTHTGMLQGNAVMGIMIWGSGNQLNITVGRGDFWDRRGGKRWTEEMNYFHLRKLLEANDEPALRAIFKENVAGDGQPRRPTVLPIGRLELVFPKSFTLTTGTLVLATGEVVIRLREESGEQREFSLDLSTDAPVLNAHFPQDLPMPQINRIPSWQYVGDYLKTISFSPPEMIDREDFIGWSQSRPNELSLYTGFRLHDRDLWLATDYSQDQAIHHINRAITASRRALLENNAAWWNDYWRDVPKIEIPNDRLAFLYHYGMYKFAGLTNPKGVPAGLQGPWIEEYQLAPWSGDYFSISTCRNVTGLRIKAIGYRTSCRSST